MMILNCDGIILCVGYFLELQDEARQEETVPAESLVRYSKLYRAVLHECVMGLREKETRSSK